jgi:HPt (histidine-containing phosphotransfer) domain-containing protein
MVFGDLRTFTSSGFLIEAIDRFLSETPSRIEVLHEAMNRGDSDFFSRRAHSLRGSAAILGALRLMKLAAQLEERSLGDGQDAAALLQAVQLEFETVREALLTEREAALRAASAAAPGSDNRPA